MLARALISTVPVLLCVAGCGSRTMEQKKDAVLRDAAAGREAEAAAVLDDLYDSSERAQSVQQRLLWRMERGAVAELAGNLPGAQVHLADAGRVVDERRSKDVVAEAATFIANDTVRDYAGKLYEHAQVDYWRAIAALESAQRRSGIIAGGRAVRLDEGRSATDDWSLAINAMRKLTTVVLTETRDAAGGGDRYRDDPWARTLAGAVYLALPADERTGGDEQFADAMLASAMQGYVDEHARMAGGRGYRYEVTRRPGVAETLFLRMAAAYDPSGFPERARRYGLDPADPRGRLAAGHGSVLVLDHRDYISRLHSLDIGVILADIPVAATAEETASGVTVTTFTTGGVAWYARGVGSGIVTQWGAAVGVPPAFVRLIAPGGVSFMGFSLPHHAEDRPAAAPGRFTATPAGAGAPVAAAAEVVCDLDAYARATLKDDQPGIMTKTLARFVAKQGSVAVASGALANAAEKRNDPLLGLLSHAVNAAGSIGMTATENADLRTWTTLPDRVEAALIDLPAGRWSIAAGAGVPPVDVDVRPGRLTILPLRSFSPGAIPAAP